MKLPGVGRKTANVILSSAFNKAAIAVDTHVFRVANRIGLANSDKVLEVEKQLMERIPEKVWSKLHHWLIFHGRRVCKARNPACEKCVLKEDCLYYKNEVILMKNNLFLLLFLFLLLSFNILASSQLEQGIEEYNKSNYTLAIDYLTDVLLEEGIILQHNIIWACPI